MFRFSGGGQDENSSPHPSNQAPTPLFHGIVLGIGRGRVILNGRRVHVFFASDLCTSRP